MKLKIIIPVLILSVMLTACGGSEDIYYTSFDHSERENVTLLPSGGEDITGYYSLKGAMMNMVNMGISEDVLRIGSYGGNLEDDLRTIIQEITTVEPIGIYGVSSISAEQTRVLTYRELAIQIQYKRPAGDMKAIVTVNSAYDLQNRISDMFRDFDEVEAFYISAATGRPEELNRQIYAAWMACGANAVGLNQATFEFYPEEGEDCVVEIRATYNYDREQLTEMADFVTASAERICEGMSEQSGVNRIRFIENYLASHASYDYSARRVVNETQGRQPKSGIYTAYGVFRNGVGAQSGLVLAASAMCDAMGLDHTVETGTVNGDIYSWIAVSIDGEDYIFDVTAARSGRDTYLIRKASGEGVYEAW